GVHPPRPYRAARLAAGPRHHELRSGDRRADLARDHGPRARARHQLLRHRQRLRLGREPRPHRGDRRQLVRLRRRPPGQDRHRDQDVRQHGRRLAQQRQAVRAEHPPGLRGLAAAAADRPHRPLPDAPRRPGHPVGRDLAGDGHPRRPGQDPLRRLVELRRLEHRPGQRGRRPAQLPRPGRRAVDLQPAGPRGRAGGAAGRGGVRAGRHPVEPAAGRPARRRAAQGAGGQPADQRPGPGAGRGAPRGARRVRGPVRGARPRAGGRGAGLAADPPGGDRPDHRAAHDGAARRGPARARADAGGQGAVPAGRDLPGLPDRPRALRLV
ncbi:MAG: Uncharacterized oxidoreductase YrpG, partial [uncultured Corynebacteriales bacterium]